jgi:GNAT superfamily N-acetyltransferase
MTKITQLTAIDLLNYKELIHPKLLSLFLNDPNRFIIWGASSLQEPLGLLLIEKGKKKNWFLRSFFVSKKYRGFGVGKALFNTFLKLKPTTLTYCKGYYAIELENSIERYLVYLGFASPSPCEVYMETEWVTSLEKAFSWLTKWKLPSNYTLKEWNSLSKKELEYIKNKETSLYPVFNTSKPIVPSVSISIFDEKNNCLGWSIGHQKKLNHIHYSSIYIDLQCRHSSLSGIGIYSLLRHYKQRKQYPFLSTTQQYPFPKGQRIVFGMFIPYATSLQFTKKKWNLRFPCN